MEGRLHAGVRYGSKGKFGILWYCSKRGGIDEVPAAAILDVLQDYENKLAAGQLPEGQLKQAMRRWKSFKNFDDLRPIQDTVAKRIWENRLNLLQAIHAAWIHGILHSNEYNEDASKIAVAAEKSLRYRHPILHRLQRLPINAYNRLKKQQS